MRFAREGVAAHGHPWEVRRLSHEHASHIMVPMEGSMNGTSLRMFREEREDPQACDESRAEAFERTLDFLRRW